MGHAIPKIHYKIISKTGDTASGTATLLNIVDTSLIEVGMFVDGAGIPALTTVLSKTLTSVTVSANSTANAVGISLEFYKKIEFDYPPIETTGEKLNPQERRSIALSGVSQVSIDHIEGVRALNFSFLSDTLYTELKAFYDTSAIYGDSFKYFDDKTTTTYFSYELKTFDWNPQKQFPKGTSYIWAVPLQFRRVV